jgi:hypothetical protein
MDQPLGLSGFSYLPASGVLDSKSTEDARRPRLYQVKTTAGPKAYDTSLHVAFLCKHMAKKHGFNIIEQCIVLPPLRCAIDAS